MILYWISIKKEPRYEPRWLFVERLSDEGLLYKAPTPWKEYQMDLENLLSELKSRVLSDREKEFGDRFIKLPDKDLDELLELLSSDDSIMYNEDDFLCIENIGMRIKIKPID